jgi:hypothetical protein
MAGDDLTSIPGLLDRHRRALARLGIDTFEGLADADPKAVAGALSKLKPRPKMDEVRAWQEEANRRRVSAEEAPGWEPVATFVVSFEQRVVDGRPERRLVAQQAEVETEPPTSVSSGWDCGGICEWLQGQVGAPEPAVEAPAPALEKPSQPVAAPVAVGSRHLRFQNVALVDSTGTFEVVSEGRVMAAELECTLPARLEIQVAGNPDREVQVALRFSRTGQPRWSPVPPAAVPAQGPLKVDLSEIAAGQYRARLVAWAPDASAEPVGVELGTLKIQAPGS